MDAIWAAVLPTDDVETLIEIHNTTRPWDGSATAETGPTDRACNAGGEEKYGRIPEKKGRGSLVYFLRREHVNFTG